MRILFTLTKTINPSEGGVQHTTFKLGRFFTQRGLDVYYYSLKNDGHVPAQYGQLSHSPKSGGLKVSSNSEHMAEFIREVRPDVVINQMPYEIELRQQLRVLADELGFHFLGCLRNSLFSFKNNALNIAKQHLPVWIHRLIPNRILESVILKRHVIRHKSDLLDIIDKHDYFILLAPPNRDELEYYIRDYKNEKIISIPNSIPSVQESVPVKKKTLLFVGRLNVQHKRADLIIPLWAGLVDKLPEWEFKVVGSGEYFEKLKQELAAVKLPRITLEGFQSSLDYYPEASILFMPSAYEGFPNVLLEAQSFGCIPVAYKSYKAVEWIVNDGEDALLIEPFDIDKMSQSIVKLATDDRQRAKMAEAGLINARRFTIDKIGQKWLEFFDSL